MDSPCGAEGWGRDLDEIRRPDSAEDVVDLIVDKVSRLSPSAQNTVRRAACCGSDFTAILLARVFGGEAQDIQREINEGVSAGIFGETGRPWAVSPPPASPEDAPQKRYRFSRDRVREAVYSRLDIVSRRDIHLRWGRFLLGTYWDGMGEASSLEIANHFNQFESDIGSPDERRELSRLNTDAGLCAMALNTFDIAVHYFLSAVRFLPVDSWKSAHSQRFKLELAIGECECMLSRFDAVRERLSEVAKQTCTPFEHGSLSLVSLEFNFFTMKYEEAIHKGIGGLRALGVFISEAPSIGQLAGGCLKALSVMWRQPPASLLGKEIMQPPEGQRLVLRLLMRVWELSFMLKRRTLLVSTVFQMIALSRKYGNQNASAVAYCCWGILLSKIFGNPGRGLPFARVAGDLAEYFNDPYIKGKTHFLRAGFFSHWEGPISQTVDGYRMGARFSSEAGDVVTTSMCRESAALMSVFLGKPLADIRKYAEESISDLTAKGLSEKSADLHFILKEWTRRLESGITEPLAPPVGLEGEAPSPREKGAFLLLEIFRAFLAGDFAAALRSCQDMEGNAILVPTGYYVAFVAFVNALAVSVPINVEGEKAPRGSRASVKIHLRRLSGFSDRRPDNFLCMQLIVKAEALRLERRFWDAARLYRKAIEESRNRGFVHLRAIACEIAARFHDACGDSLMARMLAKQAISLYREWGAHGKAAMLRNEFSGLESQGTTEAGAGDAPAAPVNHIDLSALMKSVEAISTEIILDRLLERLVRIVMESSGAQRGVVMVRQDGGLIVRIEGLRASVADPAGSIEAQALSVPVEQAILPQGIISFVDRTRDSVLLENAALKGPFSSDPYIRKTMMKSVLCVPLVKLESIQGIIYLENALTEGVFPPSRLQLLKLLSGQAVISLENARFHDLEMKHLQAKVNPHFIFNALSSVAELCHENPEEAENAIVKLSMLYRYILSAEVRFVTIGEEIEIVRKYLAIEKLRFGDRLKYSIRVVGDGAAVTIPCMLIQPLVENSIKHGISPRTSGGSIAVTVSVGERSCTIIVADDGIGVNSRNAGAGYGHASIRKRLSLQYGSNHSFIIRESNGYIVEITVPVKHTGLSGGAASTSDAVTVSGASAPESRYSSG